MPQADQAPAEREGVVESESVDVGGARAVTDKFSVLGTDFDTPDGSAIRDYIHVVDLAEAHVLAGERLLGMPAGAEIYNLGTGCGTLVLALAAALRAGRAEAA